ncbi:hypothetical protein IID27_01100 [Patescibacteria group bacterium]|nr:hypothetical protein [Patescibacteria group bacterium]
MRRLSYFAMLLRQLTRTFWVIDYPRTINVDTAKTAKIRSPTGVAEGGGLGGRLKSITAALRNFLTTTADSMVGAGWTPGRQVRATTLGDQAAAA